MRCVEVQKELSAFRDGELSPSVREAVQRHLEACGRCAVLYEELLQVARALDSSRLPERFDRAEAILNRMRHLPIPAARPALWRRFAGGAAVAAGVLLACGLLYVAVRRAPPEPSSVENLVSTTGHLVSDLKQVFVAAGRAVTSVPESVAGEAGGAVIEAPRKIAGGELMAALGAGKLEVPRLQGMKKVFRPLESVAALFSGLSQDSDGP